jgi:outer membrane autotransporter protein
MDFDLGSGDVDYEGGVVGTYLAYNNGAFYADATVKAEFLSNDYSFDGVDVSADSTSVGVSANTGYRFAMGGAYVEPLASVRYVYVSIDDFDSTDGTVIYDDPNSLKAGAGARIGTAFATGGATTELSLLGRVWNEFDGETEVTVENGVGTFTYSDDISGVYGEVEGTVLVTSSDGTLSGFLSANGKFGDDFTTYGAKAGIRKGF